MKRIYNFNAGPSTLPLEVLQQAQTEFTDYQGSGMSVMELSHRAKHYEAIHQEAQDNLKKLLNIPDTHQVLFLQGGASEQFCWVPLNFLTAGKTADYIHSGSWADKAIKEAKTVGKVTIVADSSKDKPARMPAASSIQWTEGAAYAHVTSNETIDGTQWKQFPETKAPLVADMSSDILSRPLDIAKFALIYAGAQKNLGPAGVTLAIINKSFAETSNPAIPKMLRYPTHIKENSLYNTPPCFAIYIVMLVTRWLLKNGGLVKMADQNRAKAKLIYDILDKSQFYKGTAAKEYRSDMNVTFRLPTEELEEKFIAEAKAQNMLGIKGHRSVGGIRASIYNAFPVAGVEALTALMKEFEKKNAALSASK